MITQRRENHGDHLAMLQCRQPSRIFMEKNSCCVFGGIRLMSCIMSCSNRTRSLLSTEHNWWDGAEHSRKTRLLLLQAWQNYSPAYNARPHVAAPVKTYLKHLNGKFYPTLRILQILLLPTTICSDRWRMVGLSSTSQMKILKIVSMISLKRWSVLPTRYPHATRKIGKSSG